MKIVEAFQIRDKEVVAFVGGGGKTTAMFRLADELVAQGKRVVTTTTTRIFAAQIQLAPRNLRLESESLAVRGELEIERIPALLRESLHLLIVGAKSDDGKAFGIEPALVDRISALDTVDVVLVEADGSRMRPFKAPAEHEPVIPNSTTLLVPIVGIDVIGKTLTHENVHRAEIVSQIADVPLGAVLQNEHIARVVSNAQGGLKNKPGHARVIPLINKVENETQFANAEEIAIRLLQNEAIESVAIGAVKNPPSFNVAQDKSPISSLQSRVTAVILAAGGSRRMNGQVKQLLAWGETTFVENAIRAAMKSRVHEIVVVVGNHAEEVNAKIAGMNLRIVNNPDWLSGRASTVRAGIGAVRETSAGAIFINADQPFLTGKIVDSILETFFQTRAPIVVPTFDGKAGSPILFARELFAELISLEREQGGRDLLEKYQSVLQAVEIADTRAALDVDTPEEYARALRMRSEG